jgi:hypothetical protein
MNLPFKQISFASIACLSLMAYGPSARAQVIDVTSDGTAIMGWNNLNSDANDNGDPNEYNYSNDGFDSGYTRSTPGDGATLSNLTDSSLSSYDNTEWDGGLPAPFNPPTPGAFTPFDSGFVGLSGGTLSTISATHSITTIELWFAVDSYNEGGFFGNNGDSDFVSDGAGGFKILLPTQTSTTPYQVQVLKSGVWTTVSSTSNYYSIFNGLDVGNMETPFISAPVTFTLSDLADGENIDGIRVIGTVTGSRDAGQGFLSVSNMVVETPEPSTYALIGLGMAGLFVLGRFVRCTSAV